MSEEHIGRNDGRQAVLYVYAWIGRDPDGCEGIIAVRDGRGRVMPLVVTDEELARSFSRNAQVAAFDRGQSVRLVRYELGQVLEVRLPPGSAPSSEH
jgi:hypothetical protein